MKIIYLILVYLSFANICQSQILKKVLNDAKNNAESRVRGKAIQKTNQAIDSLLNPSEKKKKEINKSTPAEPVKQNISLSSSSGEKSGEMETGEGFIQFSVSARRVFKGGTIIMSGSSIKHDNLTEVKIKIAGPGANETKMVKLSENGSFTVGWLAQAAGEFKITVTSSDGKNDQSVNVTVEEMLSVTDNIEETIRAWSKLEKEAGKVKQNIGLKDRQQLNEKLNAVKEKVDEALKLLRNLNQATKDFAELTKKAGGISPNIAANLSELNDLMATQSEEMKKINEVVDHQPYDNSICEYLVMVNEACAAFATFTNFWSKSVTGVLKNILLDKGVPKQVEIINENTVKAGSNTEFIAKEGSKIFATVTNDATAFESKLGKAGVAGDLIQYTSDVLLKTYCGIFKGELTHHYTIIYRNKNNVIWWQYSYDTKAAVTFRYPKNNSGNIIKMKGNIEGNATVFRFTEDMEQEDDFMEKMKSHRTMNHIPVYGPKSVPFSSAQSDVLGFGAVARSIVTPACFNIPVDAEYNTDAGTIQLNLNDALIDFTPLVKYTYVFLKISLSGIPLFTRVDFPINKAKLTLNAVVSRNNQLTVTKDAKNSLLVKGGGDRHIGSAAEPIEHKISYSLTAKNDN
jgi:hypothetical protein